MEKNKIEHFDFVNSFSFPTEISFFLKSTDFEFALLDFFVYLINYFNNSNHHKHSVIFWVRWCSLSEHCCYFFCQEKLFFPFCVRKRKQKNVLSFIHIQTQTHTYTFKHIHFPMHSHACAQPEVSKASGKKRIQKENSRQFLPWQLRVIIVSFTTNPHFTPDHFHGEVQK